MYIINNNLFLKNKSINLKLRIPKIYTIPLDQYGITEGFCTRASNNVEYTEEDYSKAKANMEGIQKAISYAEENDYDIVKLPKGNYSICYFPNNSIIIKNVDFYCENSTLKMMFDSTHFNPYDTKYRTCKNPDCTNYNKSVLFNDDGTCPVCGRNYVYSMNNSAQFVMKIDRSAIGKKIKDLHLIGDLYERTWTDFDKKAIKYDCEAGVEWTYGIHLNGINCVLENIEAEGFMGDGLTSSFSETVSHIAADAFLIDRYLESPGLKYPVYYAECNTIGEIDDNGNDIDFNQDANETISLRSDFYILNTLKIKESGKYVCNVRFYKTRFANLNDHNIYLYFYNKDKIFLNKVETVCYKNNNFPKDSAYVRIVCKNQSKTTSSISIQFQYEITRDCKILNSYSHDNHRGGMSGAGNNYIFDNLKLEHNGLSSNGSPFFPDTTRYQYDQEESYSYMSTFKNCTIDDSFNGLLLGVYNSLIENSTFNNQQYSDILLYGILNSEIKNNTFDGSKVGFFSSEKRMIPKKVRVHDNIFNNANATFDLISDVIIENNNFNGNSNISSNIIRSNNFNKLDTNNNFNISLLECYENIFNDSNVTFSTDVADDIYVKKCQFYNCQTIASKKTNLGFIECTFDKSLIKGFYDINYKINNCYFNNSELLMATYVNITDWSSIKGCIVDNTTFTDSNLTYYYNKESDIPIEFVFNNCIFNNSIGIINKQNYGKAKFTIIFNKCDINISNLNNQNHHKLIFNSCNFKQDLPDKTNVTIN